MKTCSLQQPVSPDTALKAEHLLHEEDESIAGLTGSTLKCPAPGLITNLELPVSSQGTSDRHTLTVGQALSERRALR